MSCVRIPVTGHGPASSTVTRSTRPSSVNRWVIPSFLARMAGIGLTEGEADLDVHAGGKMVEPLQRVDGLRRGLVDVDQALVRPDLEVLLRVLVLERRADHRVDVLLGRERDRARDGRARPRGGLNDLLGRRLDGRRVVGLEADADLVLGYGCQFLSGACGVVSLGFLRAGVRSRRALRASPGISGPAPKRSYLSTSDDCRPPRRQSGTT